MREEKMRTVWALAAAGVVLTAIPPWSGGWAQGLKQAQPQLDGVAPMAGVLQVPAQYATLQEAIDAACTGDAIVLAPGHIEHGSVHVDASRVESLSIQGKSRKSPPLLLPDPPDSSVVRVTHTGTSPAKLVLRDLVIHGEQTAPYGLIVTGPVQGDSISGVTIEMDRVTVRDAIIGVQIGWRCGTLGCDGDWGAIDASRLEQPATIIDITRSTFVDNLLDGLNLYHVSGAFNENLVMGNGDEGCHTTLATDIVFRRNVFMDNRGNGIHLQMANGAFLTTNLVASSRRRDGRGGWGLLVGGGLGALTMASNNLIVGNLGSGIRVQVAEVSHGEGDCEGSIPALALYNNVLHGNGWGRVPNKTFFEVDVEPRHAEYIQLQAENNMIAPIFVNSANYPLETSNRILEDPGFEQAPDLRAMRLLRDRSEIWEVLAGFALRVDSPIVDAGHPATVWEDRGGLARGSVQNDPGVFGGPQAQWPGM